MVYSVLYVCLNKQSQADICSELAGVIVANNAFNYKIALRDLHNVLLPLERLTIETVYKIQELDIKDVPLSSQDFKNVCTDLLDPDYDGVVFTANPQFTYTSGNKVDLTAKPTLTSPVKNTRPVSSFQGNFTIGDPVNPLLQIKIQCFPATRHQSPPETVSLNEGEKVVKSSELKTESGKSVNLTETQRGYLFLDEVVPANEEMEQLMNGEFEGADEWPTAFELLAFVPQVEPWIPFDRTDYVVGVDERSIRFLKALASTLTERHMDGLVRICVRKGNKTKKGKLTLGLLTASSEDHLFVTTLPFNEDFKSYYKFGTINKEPSELDSEMGGLIDLMTTEDEVELIRNQVIDRINYYILTKIATGTGVIKDLEEMPSVPLENKTEIELLSSKLVTLFGIVKRTVENDDKQVEDTEGIEFSFI